MSDLLRTITRKIPVLRKIYHAAQDHYKLIKKPNMTPLGFLFSGNPLMERGTFEPQETVVISRYLDAAEVFVNIGANAGYYCCLAQSKKVHTLAFEPFPRNIKLLEKNLKSNSFNDVEIYPVALGNQIGTIEMFGFGTGASLIEGWAGFSKSYRSMVSCTTLDTALSDKISGMKAFILVDIEGAEKLMLEGAASTLRLEPRPVWMVEISIFELQPEGQKYNPYLLATFSVFFDAGYRAYDLIGNEITLKNLEDLIAAGSGGFCSNNIIFK